MEDPPGRRLKLMWRAGVGRPENSARRVLVIGIVLIVVLVATTTGIGLRRYNAELMDAARELRTIDLLLAEEAERSLQSVALVLDNVADQVRSEDIKTPEAFVAYGETRAVHDSLRARLAGVPQLDAVTMIGAQGNLVNFSRQWPIPSVNLSDRDYFAYLRDTPTDLPFLSEPVVNRGSGTPTVYLARRVSGSDGRFLGLVLGAIELGYFERFYASLHLDSGSFIALWRLDGVLLARYPPAKSGQRLSRDTITSSVPSWKGVEGVFEKSWTIDGGPPEWRVSPPNRHELSGSGQSRTESVPYPGRLAPRCRHHRRPGRFRGVVHRRPDVGAVAAVARLRGRGGGLPRAGDGDRRASAGRGRPASGAKDGCGRPAHRRGGA